MDYKPVNPMARGGWTGFYLFNERNMSYKMAIALKQVPTAEIFADSVSQMHSFFQA
jgi:hypothetical protein